MKQVSKIVQMVNLLVSAGADLTPQDRLRYDKSDNYVGISDEDSTNEELWGVVLMTEVDKPWLYDHLCYGFHNPMGTQRGEY